MFLGKMALPRTAAAIRWIAVMLVVGALAVPGWPATSHSKRAPSGDSEPLGGGRRCGLERWPVKTLTDPAASEVSMNPSNSTVEQLSALPVPGGFTANAKRLPP